MAITGHRFAATAGVDNHYFSSGSQPTQNRNVATEPLAHVALYHIEAFVGDATLCHTLAMVDARLAALARKHKAIHSSILNLRYPYRPPHSYRPSHFHHEPSAIPQ